MVQDGLRTNNPLYQYASSVGVYHCPGDTRIKKSTMGDGWAYDSYSKSQNVGGESYDTYWGAGATFLKTGAIRNPSQTFIFLEDADNRNRNLGAWVARWDTGGATFNWEDPVAMYHGNISCSAFADGHAEGHKWKNSVIIAAALRAANGFPPGLVGTSSASTTPDSTFIHDNYRFPGWK